MIKKIFFQGDRIHDANERALVDIFQLKYFELKIKLTISNEFAFTIQTIQSYILCGNGTHFEIVNFNGEMKSA